MKIITDISEMQRLADAVRIEGKTIGFVPTMGFLHEGHLSLMRAARAACDVVVASIFVNPTQFGPKEDFDRYPRDEEGDREKCAASGVDVLFMPTTSGMYPEKPAVFVTVEGISEVLEGAVRPGHFRGVATVVSKLLHIVKPHRAYFGQKDYQQCAVIRRMVRELNLDAAIVTLPTMREPDGLAMSSRNTYLKEDERRAAPAIFRALSAAEQLAGTGERAPDKLKQRVRTTLQNEPGIAIDYIEIADPDTLAPLFTPQNAMVLLVAVRIGRTRLIDNLLLL